MLIKQRTGERMGNCTYQWGGNHAVAEYTGWAVIHAPFPFRFNNFYVLWQLKDLELVLSTSQNSMLGRLTLPWFTWGLCNINDEDLPCQHFQVYSAQNGTWNVFKENLWQL